MLTKKQITEIREHLDKAQNPLFFFDNDIDGLASFLLLQRYIGRGRGVAMRGTRTFNNNHFRKIGELKPDYIFMVDFTPDLDKDFLEFFEQNNIPVVVIDHHDVPKPDIENYYNTFHVSKKNEPVAYLCYNITGNKKDMWLALLGCIGDCFIPEFLEDFKKEYPELVDYDYKTAFDVLYNTELGKITDILNFALKDSTTNVVNMLRFLMKANGPYDVLEENSKTKSFLSRYNFINTKIKKEVKKAEEHVDVKNKLLFFTYSGEMSLSQHISNELMYKYPEYVIIVGFIKGEVIKFSLRGPGDVRKLTLDSIEEFEGATGGGHKHATGAQILASQRDKFKENILKNI